MFEILWAYVQRQGSSVKLRKLNQKDLDSSPDSTTELTTDFKPVDRSHSILPLIFFEMYTVQIQNG